MPGPLEFVLYVFKGNLFVELPSLDNETLNDPRLIMQEALCEEICYQLHRVHKGGESTKLNIHQRMTDVFKIEIAPGRVPLALNTITDYLARKSIPVQIISLDVVPASGVAAAALRL